MGNKMPEEMREAGKQMFLGARAACDAQNDVLSFYEEAIQNRLADAPVQFELRKYAEYLQKKNPFQRGTPGSWEQWDSKLLGRELEGKVRKRNHEDGIAEQ